MLAGPSLNHLVLCRSRKIFRKCAPPRAVLCSPCRNRVRFSGLVVTSFLLRPLCPHRICWHPSGASAICETQNLGVGLSIGRGCDQDEDEGERRLIEAANAGDASAHVCLDISENLALPASCDIPAASQGSGPVFFLCVCLSLLSTPRNLSWPPSRQYREAKP